MTEDLLKALKKEYVDSLPKKIEEIQNFLKKKDIDSLQNAFHKLKGSGKTYGVEDISRIGQKIEEELKKDSTAALKLIPEAISKLEQIYQSQK